MLVRLSVMIKNCDLLTTSTVTTKTANIQIEWFALESQQLIHNTNYIIILVLKLNQAITQRCKWRVEVEEKRERRMCCLCYDIREWLDILLFSNKDDKLKAPSPASSLCWLAGHVTEPTHFLRGVENVAPGVVVWSCYLINSSQMNQL